MSKFLRLDEQTYSYILAHGSPRDPLLDELQEETARLGGVSAMQIAPEQGALLTLLGKLIGARRAVEIGTFTGYSALCLARGLSEGGSLLCCDISEAWGAIAQRYFARAGVMDRIDLRIGPALETLRALPPSPTFDLAFIDADKGGYLAYYEELVPRMVAGGLVLLDNVLWSGRVADPDAHDAETVALRVVNDRIAHDPRVEAVMLAVADGLTMARKR